MLGQTTYICCESQFLCPAFSSSAVAEIPLIPGLYKVFVIPFVLDVTPNVV